MSVAGLAGAAPEAGRDAAVLAQALSAQLARCVRYDERAALLLLEIGSSREDGDDAARRRTAGVVAAAMRRRLRSSDALVPVGDRRFAALLVNASAPAALAVARGVRAAAQEDAAEAGRPLSAAVAVCAFDATATVEGIVAEAEVALRMARRGRGVAVTRRRPPAHARKSGRAAAVVSAMQVERHLAVEPLLAEWAELHAADDRATPYGSAAWARASLEHYGADAEPWCLAVRDGGELIGLLALTRRRRASMHILRPLGEAHADCFDVLARPGMREAVQERLAQELRRRSGEWDALVLTRLAAGVTFPDALRGAGLHNRSRDSLPHPHLVLPATFGDYLGRFPSERRRRMRRYLDPLDKGQVTVRAPGVDEVPGAVARLLELRQRQWAQVGKALLPELAEERFRRFLTDVALELVPAGHAAIAEYSAGGEPFAVYLDFTDARAFHGFMGGFEPARARLEPGKLHILASTRASIEAAREVFNMGRGGEAYKEWFRPEARVSRAMAVTSGRLRSRAALVAGTLAGRLR